MKRRLVDSKRVDSELPSHRRLRRVAPRRQPPRGVSAADIHRHVVEVEAPVIESQPPVEAAGRRAGAEIDRADAQVEIERRRIEARRSETRVARGRYAERRPEQTGEIDAVERKVALQPWLRPRRIAGDRLRQRDVGVDRLGGREPPRQLRIDLRSRRAPRHARQRERVAAQGDVDGEVERRGDRSGLDEAKRDEQSGDVASLERRRAEQRRVPRFRGRPQTTAPGEVGARQRSRRLNVEADIPPALRRTLEVGARRGGRRRGEAELTHQRRPVVRVEAEGRVGRVARSFRHEVEMGRARRAFGFDRIEIRDVRIGRPRLQRRLDRRKRARARGEPAARGARRDAADQRCDVVELVGVDVQTHQPPFRAEIAARLDRSAAQAGEREFLQRYVVARLGHLQRQRAALELRVSRPADPQLRRLQRQREVSAADEAGAETEIRQGVDVERVAAQLHEQPRARVRDRRGVGNRSGERRPVERQFEIAGGEADRRNLDLAGRRGGAIRQRPIQRRQAFRPIRLAASRPVAKLSDVADLDFQRALEARRRAEFEPAGKPQRSLAWQVERERAGKWRACRSRRAQVDIRDRLRADDRRSGGEGDVDRQRRAVAALQRRDEPREAGEGARRRRRVLVLGAQQRVEIELLGVEIDP